MGINLLGVTAAAAAFLCVWFGHVAVRRIEAGAAKLWLPMLAFGLAGMGLEFGALSLSSRALSMLCGIAGMSLLWDTLELWRQQARVLKGHAPANPRNLRHVRLLHAQVLAAPSGPGEAIAAGDDSINAKPPAPNQERPA